MQYPGLIPLAILSCTEDKARTLQQIAQRIDTLPTQASKSNVTAATSVLAGLVLEKAVIQKILREEIVKDSVIYQDILQQGLQQGRQEGEFALVLRLLQRRIGPLNEQIESRLRTLSTAQLELLGEALLDFTQLEELINWLQNNA